MNRNKYMLSKDKVREHVLLYKGNELPGFISFATFTKIYMETPSQWNEITKAHVLNMHKFIYKAITRFINSFVDPLLKDTFILEFDKFYNSQITKIDKEISDNSVDERSPFTMNKYYYDDILKSRKASAERHINGLADEVLAKYIPSKEEIKKLVQKHLQSFNNISDISDINYNEQLAVEDLQEQLTAYYKVARKRLVDVLLHTIERHMIKSAYIYFDILISLDENTITSHLVESPGK